MNDLICSKTGRVWPRGHVLRLLNRGCRDCRGEGFVEVNQGALLCGCVERSVFRRCWDRYERAGALQANGQSMPVWDRTSWTRVNENYRADFVNIARAALPEPWMRTILASMLDGSLERSPAVRKIVRYGEVSRDQMVRVVEERAGRAFYETLPYGIYPPADYAAIRDKVAATVPKRIDVVPVHPPIGGSHA